MVTNYNLRRIAAFLYDQMLAEQEPGRVFTTPSMRARDRIWDNAYTGTKAKDPILDLIARGELASPLRT